MGSPNLVQLERALHNVKLAASSLEQALESGNYYPAWVAEGDLEDAMRQLRVYLKNENAHERALAFRGQTPKR